MALKYTYRSKSCKKKNIFRFPNTERVLVDRKRSTICTAHKLYGREPVGMLQHAGVQGRRSAEARSEAALRMLCEIACLNGAEPAAAETPLLWSSAAETASVVQLILGHFFAYPCIAAYNRQLPLWCPSWDGKTLITAGFSRGGGSRGNGRQAKERRAGADVMKMHAYGGLIAWPMSERFTAYLQKVAAIVARLPPCQVSGSSAPHTLIWKSFCSPVLHGINLFVLLGREQIQSMLNIVQQDELAAKDPLKSLKDFMNVFGFRVYDIPRVSSRIRLACDECLVFAFDAALWNVSGRRTMTHGRTGTWPKLEVEYNPDNVNDVSWMMLAGTWAANAGQ